MSMSWKSAELSGTVKGPIEWFRLNMLGRFLIGPPDSVWWMATLELQDDGGPERSITIDELLNRAKEAELLEHLHIPKEYDFEDRKDTQLRFVTVFAQRPFLDAVNIFPDDDAGIPDLGVNRMTIGYVVPEASIDFGMPDDLEIELTEVGDDTVMMAVIDNGMAIAHDLFRNPDAQGVLAKTRVESFWNMDGETVPGGKVSTGRIWSKAEIDTELANNVHFGLLDEDEFYRDIGLIDWSKSGFKPSGLRVSHGTHVMGLAAGFDQSEQRRPIFAVQLPTSAITDVTGNSLMEPLGLAIHCLKKSLNEYRVGSTNQRPPMVVNFSFGNFAGPHDGTGVIERMIEQQLASTTKVPLSTTLPAGNGNLSRCHAVIELSSETKSMSLDWRVQPGDRSLSDVQFWLPEMAVVPDDCVTLTVAAPADVFPEAINCIPGPPRLLTTGTGEVVGALTYTPPFAPTMRGVFTVSLLPTASPDVASALAPSGVWRITLTLGTSVTDVTVESWIRRDDTLPGFPEFGRQSYFEETEYRRLATEQGAADPNERPLIGKPLELDPPDVGAVRRKGTISGLACGSMPAVIAGFERQTADLAPYSASGPTQNIHRTGPDAAAVSDDSSVLSGVFSAGSRSGSIVAMNGTSVAAPQAARWIADRMAAGDRDGRALVRAKAAADDPGPSPPKPPVVRSGEGRMDLDNVFGRLRGS